MRKAKTKTSALAKPSPKPWRRPSTKWSLYQSLVKPKCRKSAHLFIRDLRAESSISFSLKTERKWLKWTMASAACLSIKKGRNSWSYWPGSQRYQDNLLTGIACKFTYFSRLILLSTWTTNSQVKNLSLEKFQQEWLISKSRRTYFRLRATPNRWQNSWNLWLGLTMRPWE